MQDPKLKESALWYAKKGWAVFPLWWPTKTGEGAECACGFKNCKNIGKHPMGELVPNGVINATVDPKIINGWWKRYPRANIAIAMGKSGLVALDIDPRHNGLEALELLEAKYGTLPATPQQITGSKGYHYLFKAAPIPNKVNFHAGLDTRSGNGYIVATPSLHELGRIYQWEVSNRPEETELADMPQWLIDEILKSSNKEFAAEVPEKIPEGQRDATLTSIAGTMRRRGMTSEEIFEALRAVNNHRCKPPLPDADLQKISKSVGRYEPEKPIETEPEPEKKLYKLNPISAAVLVKMELPQLRWAVPGLIPEGLTILAGRPKLGKSRFALGICLAVASGGMACGGIRTDVGTALYISLEDNQRRLQERTKFLLSNGEVCPSKLLFETSFPRMAEGGYEALEEWIIANKECRIIVIDTLAKVAPKKRKGQGDYSYSDDYDFIGQIQGLAIQRQLAIVMIHHTTKSTATYALDEVLGSTGLTGPADAVLILAKNHNIKGGAVLKTSGKEVKEQELAMRYDEITGSWIFLGDAKEIAVSNERKEILCLMRSLNQPIGPKEIAAALNKEEGTTRYLIMKLCQERVIGAIGYGRYMINKNHTENNPPNTPIILNTINTPNTPNTPNGSNGIGGSVRGDAEVLGATPNKCLLEPPEGSGSVRGVRGVVEEGDIEW